MLPSTQEELVGLNVDPGLRSRSKRSAQRCVPVAVYFSDGISEDIITDLSKLPELHVIARHSTFTYKGKAIDLKQVGRELGMRYVLEGSVRKAGNRVRVSSQLIDNRAGRAHPGDYRRAQSKIDAGTEQCPKRRTIRPRRSKMTQVRHRRAGSTPCERRIWHPRCLKVHSLQYLGRGLARSFHKR